MSKKQTNWTPSEELDLMNFIGAVGTTEGLNMFAEESGRTPAACGFRYYHYRPNYTFVNGKAERITEKQDTNSQTPQPDMPKTTEVINSGARNHKHWSRTDDLNLIRYTQEGKSDTEIAELLHRSTRNAISNRRAKLSKQLQSLSRTTMTRTPIKEYMAAHPELSQQVPFPPDQTLEVQRPQTERLDPAERLEATIFGIPQTPTYLLVKGSEILIPVSVRLNLTAPDHADLVLTVL